MSASVVANTSRLTVVTPKWRVDLAVPVDIPVADLLAILVTSLGPEVADDGAAQGGWVLQKLGQPPLDPAASLAAAQIRDGDVLHLRPRSAQLPEIAFDDVLDAVAAGVLERTPRWTARHTAVASTLFASALLLFALVATLVTGPRWLPSLVCDAVVAALLVLAAAALRRVYGRRGVALTAAGFAIAFGAAAGATAVGGQHSLWHFGATQLLPAACAAVFVAALCLVVLGEGVAGLVAVIGAGALTAIGTGASNIASLRVHGAAALVAALALSASPFLPILAFRLSRLPLPSIPTDADDLRRDTSNVDGPAILDQAARADQYLTGLVAACAATIAGASLLLADGGVSERILAAVLGAVCLLRARLFAGRGQRAALLVAGGFAGLGLFAVRAAAVDALPRVLGYAVPAVVVAGVFLIFAVSLPARRLAPTWGRAADLVESLLVLSVIPLALGVVGVYGAVRGLSN